MGTYEVRYQILVPGQVEYSNQTNYSVWRELDAGQGSFEDREAAMSYAVHRTKLKYWTVVEVYTRLN